MWGRGQRGTNAASLALAPLSVTSPATHKWIGPFWRWFPGRWVCVHSRTLCVPPMDSLLRLGVFPATAPPTDFYSQRLWGFGFPMLEPWVAPPLLLPSHFSQLILMRMWDIPVCQLPDCHVSSPPRLPISASPTSLDEHFFFKSLVVRLPYSSIFWQFCFFFFLIGCCPSFGCMRKPSVYTYASILDRSPRVYLKAI